MSYSRLFCLIHLLPAGVVQNNKKIKHGIPTVIATKYTPINYSLQEWNSFKEYYAAPAISYQ